MQNNMGNQASVAMKAVDAQNAVKGAIPGMDEKPPEPDPEAEKAKQRMREERDKRNYEEYQKKKEGHAAKKKNLKDMWAANKQRNKV